MEPSLEALLDRFLADGDVRAMEQIVVRTRARLLKVARRIGAPQDAEDSVQNAFHSILRRTARGPLDAPVLPWLLTTVVRIAYRRKALARREPTLADRLAVDREDHLTDDPAAAVARDERDGLLRQTVARLPRTYRDAIVLHHFEGLTVAETARLLDAPVSTVKTRLQRGRRLLRTRLPSILLWGLCALPWAAADIARAGVAGTGGIMKAKTATATLVTLLALALATAGIYIAVRPSSPVGSRRADQGSGSVRSSDSAVHVQGGSVERPVDRAAAEPLPDPVDFATVDLDRDLHGVVVGTGGAPVAGARLQVVKYPWKRTSTLNLASMNSAVPVATTRSANDGSFRLRLRRGAGVNLRASAPGYATLELHQFQAGERARVELQPAVALVVRATAPDGSPAEDTRVRVFPRVYSGDLWFEHRVKTGTDGIARFADLPPGAEVWAEVLHDVHGDEGWASIDLPRSGEHVHDVDLARGRELSGTVIDAVTGRPIEGARVGMGWTLRTFTTTAASGRYVLPGWTGKGVGELAAHAPGYGQARVAVVEGSSPDFELIPGTSARGRIVDGSGKAIADALVAAIGSKRVERVQQTSRRHTTTGGDGRFVLEALRPDIVHALVVLAPGYGRTLVEIAPRENIELGDVALPVGRSIEGRVLTAAGEPVRRVDVILRGSNDDRFRRLGTDASKRDNWYGNTESRRTDHLGRYRFPDLSPGTYKVVVRAAGHPEVSRAVSLPAGGNVLDADVRLEDRRRLELLVEDDSGAPLSRVVVRMRDAAGNVSATTGANGRADVYVKGRVKTTSIYPFPIEGKKRRLLLPAPLEVSEDQTELRLVLERGTTAQGKVVFANGKPLSGAWLRVEQDGRAIAHGTAAEDGTFSLDAPGRGTFDIVVAGVFTKKRAIATGTVKGALRSVAPGARGLTLRVERVRLDRTLVVQVKTPSGEPLRSGWVSLGGTPSGVRNSVRTNEDGVASFSGLPDRKVRVRVGTFAVGAANRFVIPPETSVVPRGQTITIELQEGVATTGVVSAPEPISPVGTMVIATVGTTNVNTALVGPKGDFTLYLPREPTGPIRVWCRKEHEGAAYVAVVEKAQPGQALRVVLALKK